MTTWNDVFIQSIIKKPAPLYGIILAKDVVRGRYNVKGIGIITILRIHKTSSASEYKFDYLRNDCEVEELAICGNGGAICMNSAYLIDESNVGKKKIKISELVD